MLSLYHAKMQLSLSENMSPDLLAQMMAGLTKQKICKEKKLIIPQY